MQFANRPMIPAACLDGVVAFVQTVEAGSFTAAAQRMGLSKSAVAKTVARMEQRLGVKLINRTTRSLNLTVEGEAFHESCLKAIDELDAAQALLAARRRVPAGRLRVDLPISFGRRAVAPALLEVAAGFPDLALEVTFTDRRVDLIEEGIDLAIRMGELDDSAGLVARLLFRQRSAICAAPAYLARAESKGLGRPRSIADLDAHDCIAYGRKNRPSPWRLMDSGGGARSFSPKSRFTLGHGDAILDAALAGYGLAYLPTWLMAEHLARGTLEMVLSDAAVEDMPVYALWPRTRDLAPKIRVVVDELLRRFSPVPPWDLAGGRESEKSAA
jgi:DNA-binding transcriptional LysR family regulator